jgi:hypothetical protein
LEYDLDHNQTVIIARYLAGPGDYAPAAFDPRELVGYTWAHVLGQAVLENGDMAGRGVWRRAGEAGRI